MAKHSAEVYQDLIERGGHLYVSGLAALAEDVQRTLEMILRREGGMRPEQAAGLVNMLKVSYIISIIACSFIICLAFCPSILLPIHPSTHNKWHGQYSKNY